MKKVVIDILPTGEVKVEAIGFEGCGCEEATKIVEGLGKITSRKKKPEYSRSTKSERKQHA